MDNFIDSFPSTSSSWSNMNASANRSWIGCVASQVDGLLESYQGDGKTSSVSLMSPSCLMENVSSDALNVDHDNKSTFTDRNRKFSASEALFLGENLLQIQKPNHESNPSYGIESHARSFSTPSPVAQNTTSGSFGVESNISLAQNALTISNPIESKGCEPSSFRQSLGAHSLSSAPVFWPPSFPTISPLSGQEKVQNFSFQGMANGADFMREASNEIGYGTSVNSQNEPNSSFLTFSSGQSMKMTNEASDLQNFSLPCFSDGSHMPFNKAIGMLTNLQPEGSTLQQHLGHSSSTQEQTMQSHSTHCNASTIPRARARRGQATDPHSIAERLRREKIAERMKNLQELVPNSNKIDKASMLDEIIDYVKFLQLQVKVLSMSRLGATGAVVPLITDVPAEDDGSLHLSPSQGVHLLDSQGNLAFEQEVVKLMEFNITTAMQYLQNKGLCLMPIALAAAISSQKGSVASVPSDRQKQDSREWKDVEDEVNRCIGVVVKQEDAHKPTGNGR